MYFSCWPTQTPPIHWMGMLQPCTFTGQPHFEWLETKFAFYWSLYCRPEEYKKKVAEYVKKYATEDALRETDKVWKSWKLNSTHSSFRRISPPPPRAQCQIFLRTRQKTWNYNLSASRGPPMWAPNIENCHACTSDFSPQWDDFSRLMVRATVGVR